MKYRSFLTCLALGWSLAVMAQNNAQQYCEEAYPIDYYTPEDRQVYIQECLAQYQSDYNTYQPENQPDYQDETQNQNNGEAQYNPYEHGRQNMQYNPEQQESTEE